MKCEKCGKEIDAISINVFQYDGSDIDISVPIEECENGAVTFETSPNWCGHELTVSEQVESILCPYCKEFPFEHKEVQMYDVVRLVCFKSKK